MAIVACIVYNYLIKKNGEDGVGKRKGVMYFYVCKASFQGRRIEEASFMC